MEIGGFSSGGLPSQVVYAGPQGILAGLDQVNVRLSNALRGRGETTLTLTVEGKQSNRIQLVIQ